MKNSNKIRFQLRLLVSGLVLMGATFGFIATVSGAPKKGKGGGKAKVVTNQVETDEFVGTIKQVDLMANTILVSGSVTIRTETHKEYGKRAKSKAAPKAGKKETNAARGGDRLFVVGISCKITPTGTLFKDLRQGQQVEVVFHLDHTGKYIAESISPAGASTSR